MIHLIMINRKKIHCWQSWACLLSDRVGKFLKLLKIIWSTRSVRIFKDLQCQEEQAPPLSDLPQWDLYPFPPPSRARRVRTVCFIELLSSRNYTCHKVDIICQQLWALKEEWNEIGERGFIRRKSDPSTQLNCEYLLNN